MLMRKFEFKDDEEIGDGWVPTWLKGANIVSRQGFAHDILEHHPNMGLGAEAEFHALGAAWWLRGETGWFSGRSAYSGEEQIARDFPSILERVSYGAETLRRPPNTRALSQLHYGDADEILREIVRDGVRMAKRDAKEREDELNIPYDTDQRILGWMRRGYRYAVARYGMGRNFDMEWLFNRIVDECEKRGRHGDLGMEMRVFIDLKRLTANARVGYLDDYGHFVEL